MSAKMPKSGRHVLLRPHSVGGPEFNHGDDRNQNKDSQYGGLRDREGWLSLSRSQRIESGNFCEALHNENKDVKVERRNSGGRVDPAPCAYQALFVQSKQRNDQDQASQNSNIQ